MLHKAKSVMLQGVTLWLQCALQLLQQAIAADPQCAPASFVHEAQVWLQQSTTDTSWVLLLGAKQIKVLPFQRMS